jgi:hypothetical protein
MSSNSKNYEILTKEIHEALLRNDGVENINVRHDVKIKGKSGATHQIDVYWEFRLACVKYKTCIECKQLNSTVKKMHVASFAAILDDIGNATGIFATTIGFQKGAVQLAQQKGIRLVLVNSLIKAVNITYLVNKSDTYITDVKYDMKQAKEKLREQGLNQFSHQVFWQKETMFFDENGNSLMTLDTLIKQFALSREGVIAPDNVYDLTPVGLFRIKSISYKNVEINYQVKDEIIANDVSKAVMEDFLENRLFYLNDDASIIEIET